jgi:hypothetical protein
MISSIADATMWHNSLNTTVMVITKCLIWVPSMNRVPMVTACDGHHKMSDLGADRELVHTRDEKRAPMWPHPSDWNGPRWLDGERSMSKTNETSTSETSNLVTFGDHNTLADSELDTVTGGMKAPSEEKYATVAAIVKAIVIPT